MNKIYDNFLNLELTTTIKEEKDGYYAFENTIFYGEKGGALGDIGTINDLAIVDLKWEDDTLYHKVDGILSDPIKLKVDADTRYINTAVQTALHIMDGYYAKLGLKIVAIGVHQNNQWYEVDSKNLPDNHLDEVQKFMNQVIRDNIATEIEYVSGKDYPNPDYQKFDEVRIIKFKDLDKQPCGTLHLHNTSQIQSFVVLDSEKTSRGTRIFITCNLVTDYRLKEYYETIKTVSKQLSVGKHEIIDALDNVISLNKTLKKELDNIKKELLQYKVADILKTEDKIINFDTNDSNELRSISQALLNSLKETKALISVIDNETYMAIISPAEKARELLESIKQDINVIGGGSTKIVSGKVNISKEELVSVLDKYIN